MFKKKYTGFCLVTATALAAVIGCMVGQQEQKRRPGPPTPETRPVTVDSQDSDTRVPYDINRRPMPTGDDEEKLLPVRVGPFVRESIRVFDKYNDPIYADYRAGDASIFLELGICGEASIAQRALSTSEAETDVESSGSAKNSLFVIGKDPSYFKTVTPLGAFMSWTRGGYYFSAHAKGGEADLDRFMEAFPY